ncbi:MULTISPECIES: hypothetical protein [Tenacibaculum]|uniref:hypothetical protein n=1 Tax=Tenacibaculum TaxID=104267 RepID=UPI001F0B4CAA|nr:MULTISPECIES: hypothetical protein [Tenacibaculum]MCH3880971.1 hypothetical protein [Tenacibaculum aquimarinum]MCH3884153.1 hypothetical protein [Tenacibaculum aquimarinum]MDO6599428.1 hypothetical protein [Tenacibaculum sp. 1_MG-2023]
MTTIPFKDKLKFALVSLKKNAPILLLCLPFIIVGSTVIYFAAKTNLSAYIFIFGILFIGIPLFIIFYTMPSSLLYYYEQEMAKKYGYYSKATVTHKEIEDTSYTQKAGSKINKIEEFNYLVSYTFNYRNKTYNNSFYVDEKTVFNKIELGDSISIKFLRTDPKKATVITRSLPKKDAEK